MAEQERQLKEMREALRKEDEERLARERKILEREMQLQRAQVSFTVHSARRHFLALYFLNTCFRGTVNVSLQLFCCDDETLTVNVTMRIPFYYLHRLGTAYTSTLVTV